MVYRLSAHLLCHDVRLSTRIVRTIDVATPPDRATAEQLLDQVAEEALMKNLGEGCPYELSDLKIEATTTES
jgi:hypothetical protein